MSASKSETFVDHMSSLLTSMQDLGSKPVWGDDLARWPNCIPPCGGAQEDLLIPAIVSGVCEVEGGGEQKEWEFVKHVEKRSVEHAVRWDDL